MKRLFCIGELLIDWISKDIDASLVESVHFIKKAGGAPANVSIAAARLGTPTAFAGKVGNDAFGNFLKKTLDDNHVDTQNLVLSSTPTTFAFVSLKKDGERDFIFQRGADEQLLFSEIELPKEETIYHFGSATGFLGGTLTETYFKTLEHALEHQFFISFDPNFRDALWGEKTEKFIAYSKEFISKADLIKLSEEEALLISGKNELSDALNEFELKENAILCITLGAKGTLLFYNSESEIIESVPVNTIDTTGAGDAFIGAMLNRICEKSPQNLQDIRSYVYFANQVAAISTTAYGAIEALPYAEDLMNIKPLHS